MTLASLVGPVAAASGVFMALSPLLQARRVRALGDSSEVSAGVFLMMRVNASIWLTYGVGSGNLVIVVPNIVALMTTTWTLLTIRRFRTGHAAEAPASEAPAPATAPTQSAGRRHAGRVRGGAVAVARVGGLVRR
ncbi:MAG TPA: SemiSWEET family transporter [Conexibacter sp.]|nr:SemiSWEET family transporter [Conexibacter sp.]